MAKFLVQLGVFASVLYTLLALDIDPVEQLVKLLPISEVGAARLLLALRQPAAVARQQGGWCGWWSGRCAARAVSSRSARALQPMLRDT